MEMKRLQESWKVRMRAVGVTGMFWGTALTDFCLHPWVGFRPGWRQRGATAAAGQPLPSPRGFGKFCLGFWRGGDPVITKCYCGFFNARGLNCAGRVSQLPVSKTNTSGSERRLQTAGGCKKTWTSRAHRGTDLVEACKALN